MIKLNRFTKYLVEQGAIFYVSHSAGKDSQSMYALLSGLIPKNQIVVVHANLGEIEWDGVISHINSTIEHDLNVVASHKTLFDMVRHRKATKPDVPSWPSSQHRQCTSDLKRAPIEKFIRADLKARGVKIGVNCCGIRAEESTARAKKKPWAKNKSLSLLGKLKDGKRSLNRKVYNWYPIFELSTKEVFTSIAEANQQPHPAYASGNERLSCVFCIMGSKNDLINGAINNPELYNKYVELEKEVGSTMFMKNKMPISLEDYTGLKASNLIAVKQVA